MTHRRLATKRRTEVIAIAVLLALLAGSYYSFFVKDGPAPPSPTESASAVPPQLGPSRWMRPVDGQVWGGFRPPDNPEHDGVDIGAQQDAPIRAAADGIVVAVACNTEPESWGCDREGSPEIRGCGWYVDIHHYDDVYTRYCHMDRRPDVEINQVVSAGQVIGVVGDTGNSSAAHLHFEVHLGNQDSATAVDPVPYMAQHGAPLGTN